MKLADLERMEELARTDPNIREYKEGYIFSPRVFKITESQAREYIKDCGFLVIPPGGLLIIKDEEIGQINEDIKKE
jgi:hypothetical protein